MAKLKGTGVALITPFLKNRRIDFKSIDQLLNYLSNYVNYLVILGTTGENTTLNHDEKNDIIECIKSIVTNKITIVLAIGGNNTEDVIRQINIIEMIDFEAILSVSPYYNRPTQEGIYQHFKKLSEETQANIIIYNVPFRTGMNVLPDTIIRLAKYLKNIVAVKESSGNLTQAYKIIKSKPDNFSVISGDDLLSIPIILGGGDGVISVIAQGLPKVFSLMIDNAITKNITKTFEYYYKLFDIMQLIYEEGNPSGIKYILKKIGICNSYLRLPLIEPSNLLKKKLKFILRNINFDRHNNVPQ